jgi:hypothetical protein
MVYKFSCQKPCTYHGVGPGTSPFGYTSTYSTLGFFFSLRGSVILFPVPRFLPQAGSNTTTITRHPYHHFSTLSLEHL